MKTLFLIFFILLGAQVSHADLLPNTDCPNDGKKIYVCESNANSGSAANVLRSIHVCLQYSVEINMILEDSSGLYWEIDFGDYSIFPGRLLFTGNLSQKRYSLLIPKSYGAGIIADFEYYNPLLNPLPQNSTYTCEKLL